MALARRQGDLPALQALGWLCDEIKVRHKEQNARRSVLLLCVPQNFYRDCWNGDGRFSFANQQMADGDVSDFVQQKGNVRASSSPDAQNHIQGILVYVPSHPVFLW